MFTMGKLSSNYKIRFRTKLLVKRSNYEADVAEI